MIRPRNFIENLSPDGKGSSISGVVRLAAIVVYEAIESLIALFGIFIFLLAHQGSSVDGTFFHNLRGCSHRAAPG